MCAYESSMQTYICTLYYVNNTDEAVDTIDQVTVYTNFQHLSGGVRHSLLYVALGGWRREVT